MNFPSHLITRPQKLQVAINKKLRGLIIRENESRKIHIIKKKPRDLVAHAFISNFRESIFEFSSAVRRIREVS